MPALTAADLTEVVAAASRGDLFRVQQAVMLGLGSRRTSANALASSVPAKQALFAAAREGHLEICAWLMSKGAQCGVRYWGALSAAASAGHAEICEMLLRAGASADGACISQETGLKSMHQGHIDTIRCLLAHGAKADQFDQRVTAGAFIRMRAADCDLARALRPNLSPPQLLLHVQRLGSAELAEVLTADIARAGSGLSRRRSLTRQCKGPK